jgi:hypothetical protein
VDIDARLVGFGDDFNAGGGIAGVKLPVFADVVGAVRGCLQLGNFAQKGRVYAGHWETTSRI